MRTTTTTAWTAALAIMSMRGPFTTAEAAPAQKYEADRGRHFFPKHLRRGYNHSSPATESSSISSTTFDPSSADSSSSQPPITPDTTPSTNTRRTKSSTTTSQAFDAEALIESLIEEGRLPETTDAVVTTTLTMAYNAQRTATYTLTYTETSSPAPSQNPQSPTPLTSSTSTPTPTTIGTAPDTHHHKHGYPKPTISTRGTSTKNVLHSLVPTAPLPLGGGSSSHAIIDSRTYRHHNATALASPAPTKTSKDPLGNIIPTESSQAFPSQSYGPFGSYSSSSDAGLLVGLTTAVPNILGTGTNRLTQDGTTTQTTDTGLLGITGALTGTTLPVTTALPTGVLPNGRKRPHDQDTTTTAGALGLTNSLTNVVGTGTGLVGTLTTGVDSATSAIPGVVNTATADLSSIVNSGYTPPVGTATGLVGTATGLVGTATGLAGTLTTAATDLTSAIPTGTGLTGTATGLVGTATSLLGTATTNLVGTATSLVGTATTNLEGTATSLLNTATTNLVGTATGAANTLTNTLGVTAPSGGYTITGGGVTQTLPIQTSVTTSLPTTSPTQVTTGTGTGTGYTITVPSGASTTPTSVSTGTTSTAETQPESASASPTTYATSTPLTGSTKLTTGTTPTSYLTNDSSAVPAETSSSVAPDTHTKAPQTIQPTGTDSLTSMTFPTSWKFAPTTWSTKASGLSTATAADTTTATSTGLPTYMPKLVQPPNGLPSAPANSTLIQLGFNYGLNYPFVVGEPESAGQIFQYLPQGIAFGLGISESLVQMNSLMPYDTSSTLHYITTLAQVYIPSQLVQTIEMSIHMPLSEIYRNPDAPVKSLMSMINPTIPILPGADIGGASSSVWGNPAATATSGPGAGAPLGGDSGSSNHVKPSTLGIGIGAVGGAAVYAAAMVYVARRYKQKRQGHQRASSVHSAGEMSQRSGGMAGFFMSGANGAGTGSGGRGSRTSAGSSNGRSVREQGISGPIMAENSLGWN